MVSTLVKRIGTASAIAVAGIGLAGAGIGSARASLNARLAATEPARKELEEIVRRHDVDKDGSFNGAEAIRYIAAEVDKDKNGLSQDEIDACKKQWEVDYKAYPLDVSHTFVSDALYLMQREQALQTWIGSLNK